MPKVSPVVRPRRPRPRPCAQALEGRSLLSLTVQIDYRFDDANFFDAPEKRAALQSAANVAVSRFDDDLAAIVPTPGNTWTARIDDPGPADGTREIENLTIPADTILVFAGGREMNALGMGGPGGFRTIGSTTWNQRVASRGQDGTTGDGARDFGPWGGSITFDSNPAGGWYFGSDEGAINGRSDFFSVALHEMTHLLGFGTSDSWESRVSGSLFTGPAAAGEYDGQGNLPLSPDGAHWASGTSDGGRETAMDPDLTTGTRKTLTALDLAGMDDVGWEIPLDADLSTANTAPTAGATTATFTVTYTHYTRIDVGTIGAGDLTVSGPNGFTGQATLVGAGAAGKSVTATYAIAAPGGTFDGSDSGSYTVVLAAGAVGDGNGNFAPRGSLGSFTVDIASPPAASLVADPVTQFGAATHDIAVTYSDPQGIDGASLDADDIRVARAGDGLALAVTSATVTGVGNTSPRAVTYTLVAPGGSWDPTDNGTYTVTLNGQQVRDAQGTAGDAGTLGTFEVSVGSVGFTAGDPATFTDASGDTVTISIKGPGTGQLLFEDAGNADPTSLVLTGTSPASSVTINAGGAGTRLGGMTVTGALKSLTARNTDLAGTLSVVGTVPKLQLRNASGRIEIGSGGSTTITLAQARDLSITSASTIKSIKSNEWLDTDDTPDTITAPVVTSLTVKGAMEIGVSADTIGKIVVSGALNGAEIRATGSIGALTAASAADSIVFAGVRPDVSALPDSLDDFANPAASIKAVTFKARTAPFSNTRIAAPTIGKAALANATVGTATGNLFGLAADRFSSVTGATSVNGAYKLSKRDGPGSGLAMIDFAIVVL
jgi:hypothetical protein